MGRFILLGVVPLWRGLLCSALCHCGDAVSSVTLQTDSRPTVSLATDRQQTHSVPCYRQQTHSVPCYRQTADLQCPLLQTDIRPTVSRATNRQQTYSVPCYRQQTYRVPCYRQQTHSVPCYRQQIPNVLCQAGCTGHGSLKVSRYGGWSSPDTPCSLKARSVAANTKGYGWFGCPATARPTRPQLLLSRNNAAGTTGKANDNQKPRNCSNTNQQHCLSGHGTSTRVQKTGHLEWSGSLPSLQMTSDHYLPTPSLKCTEHSRHVCACSSCGVVTCGCEM